MHDPRLETFNILDRDVLRPRHAYDDHLGGRDHQARAPDVGCTPAQEVHDRAGADRRYDPRRRSVSGQRQTGDGERRQAGS